MKLRTETSYFIYMIFLISKNTNIQKTTGISNDLQLRNGCSGLLTLPMRNLLHQNFIKVMGPNTIYLSYDNLINLTQ